MFARKYFCFNIPIYKNMAEDPCSRCITGKGHTPPDN